MKTDYVDILQLHNPAQLPDPKDPDSTYGGLLEAQKRGYIRFIGITNHRLKVAEEAVLSNRYDTLQFPFSSLSDEKDIQTCPVGACPRYGVYCHERIGGRPDYQRGNHFFFYQAISFCGANLGDTTGMGVGSIFAAGKESSCL